MNQLFEIQKFKNKEFKITVLPGTMHPGFAIYTFSTEELDFREQYWNIKPGDIVFDIGAAYGSYTLAALASGADKVFAFEPEDLIYPNLYKNVEINNWNDKCYVIPYGLWSKPGNINIKEYASHYETQPTSATYRMVRLDDCIEQFNISKINWIKIDVEGAEEHAILGGLQTIKKFKPNMIIECHNFMDAKISQRVKELIQSIHEYEFEEVDRSPCVMLCAKPKI